MKNRFTIGEIAKLHNIPVKTLRYYDEIGLFKPIEVDEHSKYRYYSTEQFEHLNTINYLRELGIPLKDIKKHFDQPSIEYLLEIFTQQHDLIAKKILELQRAKKRVQLRMDEFRRIKEMNQIGIPFIKVINERKALEAKGSFRSKHELELTLRQLENNSGLNGTIFVGSVCISVPSNGNLDLINSVFLLIEDESVNLKNVTTIPKGTYAVVYYNKLNIDRSDLEYLLHFVHNNGFEITGDFIIRKVIDEFITTNKSEHLLEIQIPIKPS